jgi:GT2 family glycosyltransferase
VYEPGVGLATASVRLADRPDVVNSAGNPIHLTGASWSGGFGEPAAAHAEAGDVAAASGAAMAVRRAVWDELGGFAEEFFAYYEDADLSWRAWLRGHRVVFVPEAVVRHRYEFSRNPGKLGLAERNRSVLVLTCWGPRLLLVTAPLLAGMEAMTFGLAVAQGWWREKVGAWVWLVRHRAWVRTRRRLVQQQRVVPDRDLALLLTPDLAPGNVDLPASLLSANRLIRAYWSATRRFL